MYSFDTFSEYEGLSSSQRAAMRDIEDEEADRQRAERQLRRVRKLNQRLQAEIDILLAELAGPVKDRVA